MNTTYATIWFVGLAVTVGSAIGLAVWCEIKTNEYQKRHTKMTQMTLIPEPAPIIEGFTYPPVDTTDFSEEPTDPPSGLKLIRNLMKDGEWHTSAEIIEVGGARSGLRRLRDLRKEFEISRRTVEGDYEYMMIGKKLNLDVSRDALISTLSLLQTLTDPELADVMPESIASISARVLAQWPDQTK